MSRPEDRVTAYAEFWAGALRNALSALQKELGKTLDQDRPDGEGQATETADRDDADLRGGGDRVVDLPGIVRLRGRCGDPSCDRGLIHDHVITYYHEDWERILFAHGSLGPSPKRGSTPFPESDKLAKRKPGRGDTVNCARGEPCPTDHGCQCICEHYHLYTTDAVGKLFAGPAHSRNALAGATVAAGDFTCLVHGERTTARGHWVADQ